ncbi:hypothetical protein AALP_AAs52336U000100 [Arabis alpina]|uniref:Uncharacterized protein n=1 Tax=Arabis alpina TaxID=50452 RepID=A0A087FZQ4_ARAAL|nr:hypothetical protein AALP_AAs52336U000100 [Arabis alpina]
MFSTPLGFLGTRNLFLLWLLLLKYLHCWVNVSEIFHQNYYISLQLVVEKMLASEGIKRVELGREECTKRVWEWKEKYAI